MHVKDMKPVLYSVSSVMKRSVNQRNLSCVQNTIIINVSYHPDNVFTGEIVIS